MSAAATTTSPPLTTELALLIQLHTYASYPFLYCHTCHSVVFQSGLPAHLRRHHDALPREQRRQIISQFTAISGIVSQSEHAARPLPADRSPPIPYLLTHDGFACGSSDCRFLSRNRARLRDHLNTAHALYRDACAPFILSVTLQSWYSDSRASYWVVASSNGQAPAPATRGKAPATHGKARGGGGRHGAGQLHALEALQAQEQHRLLRVERDSMIAEASRQEADSSTTPWLNYTRWPEQFASRPLDILAATAVLPVRGSAADYVLGSWEGCSFISPAGDELRLCRLVQAFDAVFQRCLDTLDATPWLLRCWLKAFTLEGFNPKPFKPLARLTTLRRYKGHWKQFLCFVLRAWRTEQPLRERIYGIQFSTAQEALMAQVWALLGAGLELELRSSDPEVDYVLGGLERGLDCDMDCGSDCGSDCSSDCSSDRSSDCSSDCDDLDNSLDEDLSQEPSSEAEPSAEPDAEPGSGLRLAERLFQLSCAFWTDISTTGITSHLPLAYFSGVLGIRREGLTFRTAYLYTTYPAGLIYVGRLLMLEYALPQQAYKTLGRPSRSAYPNQLRRLQLVRRRYLCRGGSHPMERLLDLLYQGRSIAKREGARSNISWSADGQVLKLCVGPSQRQHHINISHFRVMAWVTVQDCQSLLQELMFN